MYSLNEVWNDGYSDGMADLMEAATEGEGVDVVAFTAGSLAENSDYGTDDADYLWYMYGYIAYYLETLELLGHFNDVETP